MICVVLVEVERHDDDDDWDDRSPGGCTHGIPPDVPARLDPRPLATALAPVLAGRPANGLAPPGTSATRPAMPKTVIWVDGGDEIVAHLDSLTIRLLTAPSSRPRPRRRLDWPRPVAAASRSVRRTTPRVLSRDAEVAWQPGVRRPMGAGGAERGVGALLGLAQEHATAHGRAPQGISAVGGALRLHLETPVDLTAPAAGAAS